MGLPGTQVSNTVIGVSCIIGIVLSAYAFHVEVSAENDDSYSAMCDISEHMSCTKVFLSEYGKGFGVLSKIFGEDSPLNIPNGSMGIAFYLGIGLLCLTNSLDMAKVQLVASSLSVLTSFYLAYVLYFILHDFCVVCVSTYFVNIINFCFCIFKVKKINADIQNKKTP